MGGKSTRRTREAALWKVFSQWVRREGADTLGNVSCVTCQARMHWKESQAGHFWKRQHQATKFDERNVHVQCVRCNKYRGGAEAEHAAYILKTYGQEVFTELETKHREVRHLSQQDIEEMIIMYRGKLAQLELDPQPAG